MMKTLNLQNRPIVRRGAARHGWQWAVALAVAMVLCSISAKCQTPPPAPNILVLYNNSGEFAWLGKMHSLKLQNLLSHFDAKVMRKPLGQYVAGDVPYAY